MSTDANKRIVKNTLILYLRMFLVLGVTLYTSRVILEALGVDNYGIYSVIAGVIGFLGFINNSMSLSVQRFLTFHIGKNEWTVVNTVFNMAIIIHIVIGLVIALILWFGGEWIIQNYLVIPSGSIDATIVLFRYVIIASVFTILQVPFIGLIVAHERMDILAITSIVDVVLKLIIAYALIYFNSDSLQLYGLLLMIASALILCTYIVVSLRCIKNVSIKFEWSTTIFKSLMGFSTWSMLGEIAWAFTLQGVSVIINLFFGVIGNAAYGIASQISAAVNRFVGSFQMALNPQIIKRYAATEMKSMLSLVFSGIKFSYLLILLIAIPTFLGMETILKLWLGTVPTYAVAMCKIILVGAGIDTLSTLFATVAKAYGKIRNYQIIVSIILALNFPLSYIALRLGGSPQMVFWVYCFVSLSLLIARILIVQRMLQQNILLDYWHKVLLPIIIITIINIAIAESLTCVIRPDGWNIGFYVIVITISMAISVYTIGLQKNERELIRRKVSEKLKKFFKR